MTRAHMAVTILLSVLLAGALVFTMLGPLLAGNTDATVAASFSPPAAGLPLGSDGLGRDVWARILAGGATLLAVSVAATVVAVLAGISLGFVLSAPGLLTRVLAFLLDVLLVIPALVTVMVLVFGLGSGALTMVIAATAVTAPFVARYTRALVSPLLGADFVIAARLSGDPVGRVAIREIVPNLWLPLLTDAGARMVGIVYLVAAAGFLGFDPLGTGGDWATMVQDGLEGIRLNPRATVAPALAIAAITIPANFLIDRVGTVGAL